MLYIFNSNEQLLTILSNHSNESPAFWDDKHYEKLSGENIFSFSAFANNETSQYITEGNLVAWKDLDNYWQMFEIVRKVDTHENSLICDVECEHLSYEMIGDFAVDYTTGSTSTTVDGVTTITPNEVDALTALTSLLTNTRWSTGTVTVIGNHSFDYVYSNVYSLLQKVAGLWQGELQYRLTIVNGIITGRFVDLLIQRGQDRGKQFAYGKDIQSIERDIDISSVCTALYGRGKDSLSVIVSDESALILWGRNGGTRHRYGLYENTAQDNEVLLQQETLNDLQLRNSPKITYTLKVTVLETVLGYEDEKTRIGDTVRGIDRAFNPPLLVTTRVVEINRSLSNPEKTEVVLGTYKPNIIDDLIQQKETISEIVESGSSSPSDPDPDPNPVESATNISIAFRIDGVTITKDSVAEVWNWTLDSVGGIAEMSSDTGRTVSISH